MTVTNLPSQNQHKFGIEIEYLSLNDSTRAEQRQVLASPVWSSIVVDGTLDEFITAPLTLNQHYSQDYSHSMSEISKFYVSHSGKQGIGVHLNLDKSSFVDKEHFKRFLGFITKYETKLTNIYGRNTETQDRCSNFQSKRFTAEDNVRALIEAFEDNCDLMRMGVRIKPLLHGTVVELRWFGSTTSDSQLYSYMEYITHLIESTKTSDISYQEFISTIPQTLSNLVVSAWYQHNTMAILARFALWTKNSYFC